MPAVQISFVPWMFDDEVVEHARDMMNLHAQYAPTIIQLATQGILLSFQFMYHLIIKEVIWK